MCGLACLLWASAAGADFVKVSISGIQGKLLTNVKRTLSIAQEHKDPWSERRIRSLFRVGRAEARKALEPFGYYNPSVKSTLRPPPPDGGEVWHASYTIEKGPPTTVKKLKLDITGPGADHPALEQVVAESTLHKGDQLHHSDYKATKGALSSAAYSAGFLQAHFARSVIRVNPETNEAVIKLVMATGERFYFGRVHVKQDFLKPDFVHKFVPFETGQPFKADRLLDMQLVFSQTDYFSQVMIDARRDKAYRALPIADWFYRLLWPSPYTWRVPGQLRVPIDVAVKPSKPQHYRISAGYGTDTGPRAGFGVKFRHLNEYGHQFRLDVRVSAIEQTVHASYDIPIENVIRDRLSFVGALSSQEFGDVTSNFIRVGVVRDTGWAQGRNRPYLKAQFETYDLHDGAGYREALLIYPGYTWTLHWIDDVLKTRKGFALRFDVRGASQALGSSTDYLRGKLSGGLIWPMTQRTRLLLRGSLGAMSVDEFKKLPPSQRFFAGGGSSVRGYGYQELSPVNDGNVDVGGKYLATASIETDYRFYKDFYLAAFYDVGNASNSLSMDLKSGVGVGFRWASPVGMIRLDLAHPLDDPDTSIRIHFSIGPAL